MSSQRPHLLFRPESISRGLGLYIPATGMARALGLARGVILAWLISKYDFGLFQVALLVVNVLNPLCGLGLNEGLARYVPTYETRGTLRSYLRKAVPFIAAIAGVLSAIVYVAARPLGEILFATLPEAQVQISPETWTTLTRIGAVVTFATVLYFTVLAILKGLRMFRAVSLLEFLNNLLFTVFTITAALGGWKSAGAMMACYGATFLIVLPLFGIPLWRNVTDEPEKAGAKMPRSARETSPLWQLVSFSAWAAVAAVVWQVLQYYPMWFLQKTHGHDVTAVFGGVRLLTQVVVIGAVTIIAVIQTSVTKLWEAEGRAEADRLLALAYKSTSLVMLVGCVLFAAAAHPIMRLFPPSFAIGVPIVALNLMFFLISSHLTFLAIHFALIERMRHLFWPWTLGLACNVLFGFWLVSPYAPPARALIGAAWAGVLGISAALVAVILLMRVEKRPIDAGTAILWVAIYVLALPVTVQLVCLIVILALSIGTHWILTADEKTRLREYLRRSRLWLFHLIAGQSRQGGAG